MTNDASVSPKSPLFASFYLIAEEKQSIIPFRKDALSEIADKESILGEQQFLPAEFSPCETFPLDTQ
jgi:hypothetical protein